MSIFCSRGTAIKKRHTSQFYNILELRHHAYDLSLRVPLDFFATQFYTGVTRGLRSGFSCVGLKPQPPHHQTKPENPKAKALSRFRGRNVDQKSTAPRKLSVWDSIGSHIDNSEPPNTQVLHKEREYSWMEDGEPAQEEEDVFFFFFITLNPRFHVYEPENTSPPSSEPLHISARQLFLN